MSNRGFLSDTHWPERYMFTVAIGSTIVGLIIMWTPDGIYAAALLWMFAALWALGGTALRTNPHR